MFPSNVASCSSCPLGRATTCPFRPLQSPRGTVLISQGQIPDRVYFLRSGTVALSSVEVDGGEGTFALRGPRALLGTEGLARKPARAEVRALSAVRTCAASVEEVRRWMGPEASPARVLFDLSLESLGSKEEDDSLRRGEALARVARFLTMWSLLDPPPPLPRQVMAKTLAMRPETLSRCLNRLGQQGLIRHAAALEVLDHSGLRALAGENA